MNTSAPFSYSRLEEVDTIRLLMIEDEEPFDLHSEHVQCRIQNFTLSSKPHYRALSYAWGDTITKEIKLNDQSVDVRSNLWAALIHLRLTGYGTKSSDSRVQSLSEDPAATPWMWIDALCINQNSMEERNNQVRLMGRIYQEADQVVVWLGCESLNGSSGIPRFVQDMSQFHGAKSSHHKDTNRDIGTSILENFTVGLAPFLELPYWNRMWIVQEVCLNSRITLMYDQYTSAWAGLHAVNAFVTALPLIRSDYKKYNGVVETRNRLLYCQAFGLVLHKARAEKNNLDVLVSTFEKSICFNPRDKVYALLGLAKDCIQHGFPIDYAKSLFEVYKDTVYFCLLSRGLRSISPERVVAFSQTLQRSFGSSEESLRIAAQLDFDTSESRPLVVVKGWHTDTVTKTGARCDENDLLAFQSGKHFDFDHDIRLTQRLLLDLWKLRPMTITGCSIEVDGYSYASRPSDEFSLSPCVAGKPCTPFTTNQGRIGYGGEDVRDGDLVCRFSNSDVVVLVRRIPHRPGTHGRARLDIVGRAFLTSSRNEREMHYTSTAIVRHDYALGPSLEETKQRLMWSANFQLNMLTLQQLTS